MNLDLPTLMVMQSFALACAGAVLFSVWLPNRIVSALALWGLANVSAAAGFLSLMLGFTLHQPIWLAIGGSLLPLQASLMWKATRSIESKPTPLALVFLGPMIVGLTNFVPGLREVNGALPLATGLAYTLAATTTLWLGRTERLTARWPLIILLVVHAAALSIGMYTAFIRPTSHDIVPSIASLFGLIYFESIVFALGTAVFVIALVKERSEAAGVTAGRIDPLSGILNRAGFMDNAGRMLERCRRDGAPVSVMMFDLDGFKTINDTYGHAAGDAVIRRFCENAIASLRPNDVFGRLGGEEFAVVLPGSGIEAAHVRAERIRASFAENCQFILNRQVNATVSGGVAMNVTAEQSLDALLEISDAALYDAKTEGRNRIKRADQPRAVGGMSNVFRVA
jgi:diguanylate cyclase (GGDEF)-like protein